MGRLRRPMLYTLPGFTANRLALTFRQEPRAVTPEDCRSRIAFPQTTYCGDHVPPALRGVFALRCRQLALSGAPLASTKGLPWLAGIPASPGPMRHPGRLRAIFTRLRQPPARFSACIPFSKCWLNLVRGAGFEPATCAHTQMADYESAVDDRSTTPASHHTSSSDW